MTLTAWHRQQMRDPKYRAAWRDVQRAERRAVQAMDRALAAASHVTRAAVLKRPADRLTLAQFLVAALDFQCGRGSAEEPEV